MFRLFSHLRPSASASRLRPSSTVPHLRPGAFATASRLRASSTHLRPGASVTAYRLGPSSSVHAVTFGNTPQYGVRRLSSLSPAETGSNHGGKTNGGEKMPQDNSAVSSVLELMKKLIKQLRHKISLHRVSYGVLGVICLGYGYVWYRKRCIDAALEEAYPCSDSDDGNFIKRPDAEKYFDSIVQSSPSVYSVIVGSRGTGKSTLVRKVACKTPGVIYVNITPMVGAGALERNINSALREALRLNWTIPKWLPELLSVATVLSRLNDSAQCDGFLKTLRDFEQAAARYKARHDGSCAVLVIDNTDEIARHDLQLLRMLQETAKFAADNALYKVIFVTSDVMVPMAMRQNSGWSRAEEYRVGDLTENEARAYIEKCKVPSDTDIDKLIRECGTRIMILQRVCNKIQGGKGLDEVITESRSSALLDFGLAAGVVGTDIAKRVALAVAKDGSVNYTRYLELCGGNVQTANYLLQENIFVLNVAGKVRFENMILESAIQEEIARKLIGKYLSWVWWGRT